MRTPFLIMLMMPLAAAEDAAWVYKESIAPMMAASCNSCHGESKQKGRLRLDSLAAILAGGAHGAVVLPGDAAHSPLYQRVILPADDGDVMPAKGEHLTPAQCEAIKRWIDLKPGAAAASPLSPSMKGGAAAPTPAAKPEAKALVLPRTDVDALAEGLAAPDQTLLAVLKDAGVWQRSLSRNGALLEVELGHATAAQLAAVRTAIKALAPNIAILHAGGPAFGPGDGEIIAGMRHLVVLDAARSAIGDADLARLAGLAHLRQLNLVGSAVSDAGVESLARIASLEDVHLWESKVSPAGVARLRSALPKARIDDGSGLDELPQEPLEGGKGKKKR